MEYNIVTILKLIHQFLLTLNSEQTIDINNNCQ